MQNVWTKRYRDVDAMTREKIFRCTRNESRAFAGNFAGKIDARYQEKLKSYNLQ